MGKKIFRCTGGVSQSVTANVKNTNAPRRNYTSAFSSKK